jgi:hypothetical protein
MPQKCTEMTVAALRSMLDESRGGGSGRGGRRRRSGGGEALEKFKREYHTEKVAGVRRRR